MHCCVLYRLTDGQVNDLVEAFLPSQKRDANETFGLNRIYNARTLSGSCPQLNSVSQQVLLVTCVRFLIGPRVCQFPMLCLLSPGSWRPLRPKRQVGPVAYAASLWYRCLLESTGGFDHDSRYLLQVFLQITNDYCPCHQTSATWLENTVADQRKHWKVWTRGPGQSIRLRHRYSCFSITFCHILRSWSWSGPKLVGLRRP